MQISQVGIDLIKRFEGFASEPYYCPGGKLTVGYGHVMTDEEAATVERITKEHAEILLRQDAKIAEEAINKLVSVAIKQNQFDALVSFVFNVGGHAFEKSTMLKLLNNNDIGAAARQFDRWVYAAGKKLEGLARRRAAEKALFLGDADI